MIVLAIKETSYLVVSLFDDLVAPSRIYIFNMKFLFALFASIRAIARKRAMPSPNVI